jgi:hypothetical protein
MICLVWGNDFYDCISRYHTYDDACSVENMYACKER